MLDSYLHVHRKANDRTSSASFKRGIISAIYSGSFTADIIILGNTQTILKNVSLSSAINIQTVKVGMKCRIDMFDETNPNDCVVAYVY